MVALSTYGIWFRRQQLISPQKVRPDVPKLLTFEYLHREEKNVQLRRIFWICHRLTGLSPQWLVRGSCQIRSPKTSKDRHWTLKASSGRNSKPKNCPYPRRSAPLSTISCTHSRRKVALTASGSKYGLNLMTG